MKKGGHHSKKWCEEHSKKMRGKGNPNFGKHHSVETKRKMSEARKGKYEKANHPLFGKHHSVETRKKISEAGKKTNHSYWLGKHRSDETKQKISKAQKGKQGNIQTPELREASRIRMLNGGAAHANSFIKNPSKPQVELFQMVQYFFSDAQMNFPSLNYSIDIALPKYKIAIEYDGSFWHNKRKEYDIIRQKQLEKIGWQFLRYLDKIPNNKELYSDLKLLACCIQESEGNDERRVDHSKGP